MGLVLAPVSLGDQSRVPSDALGGTETGKWQAFHSPLSRNPRKTFWESRPEGKEPTYGPDMINRVVGWVVGWSRRVLPDSEARDAAIDRAERNLNPKAVGRGW